MLSIYLWNNQETAQHSIKKLNTVVEDNKFIIKTKFLVIYSFILYSKSNDKKIKNWSYTDKEALDFHIGNKSGKIEVNSSKPLISKRDLSLAYSPGVAAPVKEISKDSSKAYDYTSKGNLVAVISNGSAILGLGNLGSLASKPVMEGKAVLFKRFADIDSIDIEIDNQNTDEIISTIKNIAGTFGGINLEDIAAPDCFIIEQKLKEFWTFLFSMMINMEQQL